MKFDWDLKVELKKTFKLYYQILLKVLTKVGLNFIHFSQMKVSKLKPFLPTTFFYQVSKVRKYLRKFWSHFSLIEHNLSVFNSIQQNFMALNKILQRWTKFGDVEQNSTILDDIKWKMFTILFKFVILPFHFHSFWFFFFFANILDFFKFQEFWSHNMKIWR